MASLRQRHLSAGAPDWSGLRRRFSGGRRHSALRTITAQPTAFSSHFRSAVFVLGCLCRRSLACVRAVLLFSVCTTRACVSVQRVCRLSLSLRVRRLVVLFAAVSPPTRSRSAPACSAHHSFIVVSRSADLRTASFCPFSEQPFWCGSSPRVYY